MFAQFVISAFCIAVYQWGCLANVRVLAARIVQARLLTSELPVDVVGARILHAVTSAAT